MLKSCPYFALPATPRPRNSVVVYVKYIFVPMPSNASKISPNENLTGLTSPVSLSSKCPFLLPSPFNAWHFHATSQIKSLSCVHDCAFSFTISLLICSKSLSNPSFFLFFYPSSLPYFPSLNLIFIVMLACSLASDSSLAPGILPLPQISFHTSARVAF